MNFTFDHLLIWVASNVIVFGPLFWPAWLVSKRAGLPGWLGLLIFVPFVNVLAMWAFALLRWPIDKRPAAA